MRDDLILLFVRTIQGFMSADADLIVDNAMRLADAVLECYVLEEISHDDA